MNENKEREREKKLFWYIEFIPHSLSKSELNVTIIELSFV